MEDKDLYKKTDGVLFNYKSIKAEISNLDLEIEEIRDECDGVKGMTYEEKTGPTNAFNSTVENEVIKKEKEIVRLLKEKKSKERLITKIDNALESLEEEEKEIIKLRCFERKSWNKVGMITNRDGDYCGKIKRAAVNKLSELVWVRKKYT
ncbi:siderophore-interacting protein [Clostridium botulinum]|uniref:siderophore-interacting protein n=1 Tax=Clostridium botulinum TaxID=1491 RepID=UPI0013F7D79B|nr:siderophore-interacting protein [Clostridium botulinum]MBY6915399.1 siderophore-interacting protein [Clostridium botulinum]NFO38891.1 siderophore-interacting protein [Clostridium botulinum]NFO46543.1 siderophore-interacting protein [Clostridium botulinum]NFQ37707.1 siderophore-interacting protein [Clostridium botulinum]